MQKNEVGPLSNTIQKINSEWIKNINVRSETKILGRKHRKKLYDIRCGSDFLDTTKSQGNKNKIHET